MLPRDLTPDQIKERARRERLRYLMQFGLKAEAVCLSVPSCRMCDEMRSIAEAHTYGTLCESCYVKAQGVCHSRPPKIRRGDVDDRHQRGVSGN